ncbi:PREDICTED: uncharacterized protein LOC107350322 [Acropora digitifera]|uniref:uncharacterized protein LOC107350322 n=1 Tax=Acropora digitifera TaxID=70779 RepID=UPI00077A914C|nr:PREDICTED: uncharacterized protein LOC107350322 [Acropora digitifera]
MAAADVGMILSDFWKIWSKTLDAENDFQVAYCLLEWTQRFVENLAPLAHPGKKPENFPYQRKKLNTWFKEEHSGVRNGAVNLINVDKDGQNNNCYTQDDNKFPNSPAEDDKYEIFYHGTTARHAKLILEDGIDLCQGGERKDFSDGDGFYVTNKFDNVWPNARWSKQRPPCSTVLVFKVDKSELRNFRSLDLWRNFDTDLEENWRDVVWKFRNGKADDAFIKDLKVDFIEGPLCAGTQAENYDKPQSCIPHRSFYQLCVRSDPCAKLFDKSLLSVVFFKLCRE